MNFCLSDIDECAAPVDPCNAVVNSACNNTNGSYVCQCLDGFVKNGSVCEGEQSSSPGGVGVPGIFLSGEVQPGPSTPDPVLQKKASKFGY